MKFFIFLLLLPIVAGAGGPLDHKKGIVAGVGINGGSYIFPIGFEGQTRNKIDDSVSIVGPNVQLGYDYVFSQRILVGLRVEGIMAQTFGMNEDRTDKIFDETKGKSRALHGTMRLGWVDEFIANNPVGDSIPMAWEIFIEGGLGSGKNDFDKTYTFDDDTITESYFENQREVFTSQIMSAGFSLTSIGGAFLELKFLRMAFGHNHIKRQGNSLEDGGVLQSFSESQKNTNPGAETRYLLTFGHHY